MRGKTRNGAKKVVVLGARGQLGNAIGELSWDGGETELILISHEDLDVCEYEKVRQVLSDLKPWALINTAAFHKVDFCEDQAEMAFKVNAVAVRNMAGLCAELDSIFIHFSTDYVFDGRKREPYLEEDLPGPLSVYAASKLAGEYFARCCLRHFVIRTCGLYGRKGMEGSSATAVPSGGKGGNFVLSMLHLAGEGKPIRVVNDQILTPTSTKSLAKKVQTLLHTKEYGLYHITDEGECSWYEFAKTVFELAGVKADLSPVTSDEFGARARRPLYSVLKNNRLERFGMNDMPCWKNDLEEYVHGI